MPPLSACLGHKPLHALVDAGEIWLSALSRNKYLLTEIIRPFVAVLTILVLLFAGYGLAGILSNAVSGLLPIGAVAALTGLKVLISLEVLIPISLFMAVVIGFGRMQADSEITAMLSLGIGSRQFLTPVIGLACGLAIGVSCLSLFARSWAYQTAHEISNQAAATLNVSAMEAGTFYASLDGSQVIFLGQRAGPNAPAHKIFVARRQGDQILIISAASATPPLLGPNGQHSVQLQGVHLYHFYKNQPSLNQSLQAMQLHATLNNAQSFSLGYSSVTASTAHLLRSDLPADVAERQWRFSTGISTLLLAILGAILSRSRPRQSRYTRFGPAILAYSIYYLLCTTARTWVEHGTVGAFPGLWWAPALLAVSILCIWYGPSWARSFQRLFKTPATTAPTGQSPSGQDA